MDKKPAAGLMAVGALAAGVEWEIQTSENQSKIIPESREQIFYGRADHGPEGSSYVIHTIEGVLRLATTSTGPM
jgi:hypothetical protein